MIVDRYSGAHSTDSAAAVAAFETAIWNVLSHRPAGAQALAEALTHDPGMAAAHALRGFAGVMLARRETVAAAAGDLARAREAIAAKPCSAGERVLVVALEHAAAGRLRAAAACLEDHVARTPHDLLALKLAHSLRFMGGDPAGMRACTELATRHWTSDRLGYGFVLGCHAFALEETGDLRQAEKLARRALDAEPADAWGLHALGHVLEMQGRAEEGVELIERRRGDWTRCNNFAFHMAWHLALFHMARGRAERALDLYDREVRPSRTDDFRDVANAVSLLWRLRQEGVDVGDRWDELAGIARRRLDDTTLIFASLHHLLTLIAVGDRTNAARAVAEIAACAQSAATDQSAVARGVGLDLARAIHSLGASRRTRPGIERLACSLTPLGGSRAQRDVFTRTLALIAAQSGERRQVERVLAARMRLSREDRFSRLTLALLGGRAACSAA
ncbi:MAG TPA: tetratricopeptide repeat protein [Rhodoblastus sp.]|nr:tetratricopeptide repeat protein [Rhodoblastus sp.]